MKKTLFAGIALAMGAFAFGSSPAGAQAVTGNTLATIAGTTQTDIQKVHYDGWYWRHRRGCWDECGTRYRYDDDYWRWRERREWRWRHYYGGWRDYCWRHPEDWRCDRWR